MKFVRFVVVSGRAVSENTVCIRIIIAVPFVECSQELYGCVPVKTGFQFRDVFCNLQQTAGSDGSGSRILIEGL